MENQCVFCECNEIAATIIPCKHNLCINCAHSYFFKAGCCSVRTKYLEPVNPDDIFRRTNIDLSTVVKVTKTNVVYFKKIPGLETIGFPLDVVLKNKVFPGNWDSGLAKDIFNYLVNFQLRTKNGRQEKIPHQNSEAS